MAPKLTYIDNGFYEISAVDAKRYAGSLPPFGYTKDIEIEGEKYRLQRTQHNDKTVWAVWQPYSMLKGGHNPMSHAKLEESIVSLIRNLVSETMQSGVVNLKNWWEHPKEDVMTFVYWTKHQLPPSSEQKYEQQWQSIKQQLIAKFPPPSNVDVTDEANKYSGVAAPEHDISRMIKMDPKKAIARGVCAACRKKVGSFYDLDSEREYQFRGLCQDCQNKVYGEIE